MDIQVIRNNISDLRADIARLQGNVGSMDTMIIGLGVLIGANCIATLILAIAIWSMTANGG
jgi:hypothetical protein